MCRTFTITNTFWSAIWRTIDEFRQTGTRGWIVYDLTVTIKTTWRRGAWIDGYRRLFLCWKDDKKQFFFVMVIQLISVSLTLLNYSRLEIHWVKGSPVKSTGQEQIGLWLTTVHCALIPQVPGHGSIHFWLLQAMFAWQSELIIHSARQLGGVSKYPGIHEQTACSFIFRHWLFGPHGVGLHGSFGIITA